MAAAEHGLAERLPAALAEVTAVAAERLPAVPAEVTVEAASSDVMAAGPDTVAVIVAGMDTVAVMAMAGLASATPPTGAALTRRTTAATPTMTPTDADTGTATRATGAGASFSEEVTVAAITVVGTVDAGTPDAAMLAAGPLAAQLDAARSAVGSAVSADAEYCGMKHLAAASDRN